MNVRSMISSTLGWASAAFRLGRLDRATASNNPPATSGDLAAVSAGELMHRRARDMARNNAHARRVTDAWQDLLVGCSLQTMSDPFEPWIDLGSLTPSDLDERLAYALESDEVHDEWFKDRDQFSADGRFDGASMQRMAVSECVQRGECFVVESWIRRPNRLVPLCYQILESEQLDRTISRPGSATENRIVEGIEIDSAGREVAYYLFQGDHPFDPYCGFTGRSVRVTADRCLHLHLPLRPSSHHGTTWYHASGQTEIDRDRFLTTEIATAAKDAAFAFLVKRAGGGSTGMGFGTGFTANGEREVKLSHNPMGVEVGPNDTFEMVESKRPNRNAEPFLRLLDRYAAGGYGLSYYTLTGDYAATAYSSAQAARQDEDQHVRPIQQWLGLTAAVPMRRRFNSVYAVVRGFSTVDVSEFVSNPRRFQRIDCMGPGRDFLNPLDESEAAVARMRAGISTLKHECAKRGLHWIKVLRQIRLENQLAKVLGVVLDFSKGQGGQVRSNTREATSGATSQGGNADDQA